MRRASPSAWGAAMLAVVLAARSARADDDIRVIVESCPLDQDELGRLVRLELSSVLDSSRDASSYVVTIRCAGEDAEVAIFDPLTSKTLQRKVAAPPAGSEEAERQLAITIAQLYRASWLELDAPPPPENKEPLPPRVRPRGAGPEIRAARQLSRPTAATGANDAPAPSYGSFGLVLGARVRRVQRPIVLPSVELLGSWAPTGELFWLCLTGGLEYANLDRRGGALDVIVGKLSVGGAIEPLVAGPWSGFAEASAGVAINHIAPSDVLPGFTASGPVRGAGFEAGLGIGVALRAGPLRLELLARGGALTGTPLGRVSLDDDVDLDGPWVGADWRMRWMF